MKEFKKVMSNLFMAISFVLTISFILIAIEYNERVFYLTSIFTAWFFFSGISDLFANKDGE